MTDTFGNFVLSVAAGSYPITITKPGWNATTTASHAVVTGDQTNAGIISLTAQAVVPGTITGTVVDAAGGSPSRGSNGLDRRRLGLGDDWRSGRIHSR